MKKLYTFCWILFSLLSACSNSELYTTEDFSTEVNTSIQDFLDNIIVPTEKENSPSGAATDSARVPNDSINAIIAQAASRALIPAAGFKKAFTLSPPSTQGIVQCTFDGSEPDSTTKAFLEDRLIDTTTVVRCYEFIGGILAKKQTETYFVNEKINMPVVSISVDPYYVKEYLDAEPCKPYPCYSAKFWEDVEYPTHVEYFPKGSSSKKKAFEVDAGLSITGNFSRDFPKKSVSVRMRKQYQSGKIHYPIFEVRPEKNTFKSFTLRNNGNRFASDYIEDAMATSLLEGTTVDYQRSKHVVVFYNGEFRGIYDLREKLNEHFIETNYGIDNNSVDLIKLLHEEIETKNGSADGYRSTLEFIDKSNFKDDNTAYDLVSQMINITNYMEYMAAQIFYANDDWPQANVRAWKSGNSPWKFIAFDIDQGLDWMPRLDGFTENTNMIKWILGGGRTNKPCAGGKNSKCFTNIFIKLIQNPSFKQSFINRASYLYSTFINGERVAQQIDHITKSIDPEQIKRDQQLYKRSKHKNACGTYFETDGSCLKKWSYNRDKTVRNDFKEAFGLNDDVPITIKVKGNGTLRLDGFDIKQSPEYNWNVFEHHPMKLSVECPNGSTFITWEDGSTDPNRVIDPTRNSIYTAECQ
ncbi:CotH kinase family protein [uncultured Fibrobacter sp.]|uniref:CotH kinase family protein n=1 Tax=uncultured Fibrobacter sp. TaxID=261512 RepID=UPI00263497AB|nr:CotH kinase family protein [uncultured Fibrobacter sp.]